MKKFDLTYIFEIFIVLAGLFFLIYTLKGCDCEGAGCMGCGFIILFLIAAVLAAILIIIPAETIFLKLMSNWNGISFSWRRTLKYSLVSNFFVLIVGFDFLFLLNWIDRSLTYVLLKYAGIILFLPVLAIKFMAAARFFKKDDNGKAIIKSSLMSAVFICFLLLFGDIIFHSMTLLLSIIFSSTITYCIVFAIFVISSWFAIKLM